MEENICGTDGFWACNERLSENSMQCDDVQYSKMHPRRNSYAYRSLSCLYSSYLTCVLVSFN